MNVWSYLILKKDYNLIYDTLNYGQPIFIKNKMQYNCPHPNVNIQFQRDKSLDPLERK
jgi:hypothetical protein